MTVPAEGRRISYLEVQSIGARKKTFASEIAAGLKPPALRCSDMQGLRLRSSTNNYQQHTVGSVKVGKPDFATSVLTWLIGPHPVCCVENCFGWSAPAAALAKVY